MGGKHALRLAVVAAIAMAIAAPPAQAVTARFGIAPEPENAWVYVAGAAGERNDMRVFASGAMPPSAITIVDRGATFEAGAPAPPGDCDDAACTVPCRVVTPHRARCVIGDGFTTGTLPDRVLRRHGFSNVILDGRGGGPDRVVIPPSAPARYDVYSDGAGRYRFAGPSNFNLTAAAADRALYLAGASGYITIADPNVTVRSIDGGVERFGCVAGTDPKLRIDALDYVAPDCGDNVFLPRLPTGGIIG